MIPQEAKLLDLLSNNDVTLQVPSYQRNYEWDNDQCKVFLEDLIKTFNSNKFGEITEHFFGTVTYFKVETPFGQPAKLVLIDGQQRITTTMLFLIALRDIIDDKNLKAFIDNKYLKNNSASEDTEYKIKLKQVETDWESYKKLVLGEELSEKEKNSAVCQNYHFFKNKLSELLTDGVDLSELIEKGLAKFSVVTVELEPKRNRWENPQEIFESMNSLGKPLSLADLVRNYLLLGLDPAMQDKYYKDYWLRIEKELPHLVSLFIRDYMQGMKGRAFKQASENNYKELYRQFKEIFEKTEAKELLESLSTKSTIYSCVALGKTTGSEKIDAALSDLRRLQMTTAYSFLMMLLSAWKDGKFSEGDVVKILTVFKIYCLRRRIVSVTQADNKGFPVLVTKLPDLIDSGNKEKKMFEILSGLDNSLRLPNDIEMKRELLTMNFYSFKYCKFVLALIEENITKSRPNLNDKNLQIEHIMPKTLNDEWKKDLGHNFDNIHQEYLNTIGNLTLIRHNQELSNHSFSQKKVIYTENAGLQIAKTKIVENDKWGEKEIIARANWIIDYLLEEVLPIPEAMRKTNNFVIEKSRNSLSFLELQLIGENINFIGDPSIVARVVDDRRVEFEGKKWRLSPLTREIQTRKGTVNASGAYQGAQYWEYEGIRLADIM